MKKIFCILLSLILIISFSVTVSSAQNTIVIDNIIAQDNGLCEVIGHLSNNEVGAEVAFVMQTAESYDKSKSLDTSNVVYLDQVTTGNNGTFLLQFRLPERFSGIDAVIRMGSTADTSPFIYRYTIPTFYIDFENIENNSVLYGNDAYTMDSEYLTSEYVVQSIVKGGNIIFFKLGNNWYDLLNDAATSSAYLTEKNAANNNDVKKYCTGMYYNGNNIIQLKGA